MNAALSIFRHWARRSSRRCGRCASRAVTDSDVMELQPARSISRIERQFRATATMDSSVAFSTPFNFNYDRLARIDEGPELERLTLFNCLQFSATATSDSSVMLMQSVIFSP